MVYMAPVVKSSSQKVKNAVLVLLALWSIISLVVIVVWATSPDWKGSTACRAELLEVTEKMEAAKVVWNKNKVALEDLLKAERQQRDKQRTEISLLLERLSATNSTLEECQQEQGLLNRNITVLLEMLEESRQAEANLTVKLRLKEETVEALQENVTQLLHQTDSCLSLKVAAESQMMAAQSQNKACESSQQFLQKQLQKCKDTSDSSGQQCQSRSATTTSPSNVGSAAVPLLVPLLLTCAVLHLFT
ncbi:uncharacterized protein si:ch211-1a19.3 [Takifugu flavidus]|nr:uncharacterized protein si:ch211-1a19.3 [Takifugu flavidus]